MSRKYKGLKFLSVWFKISKKERGRGKRNYKTLLVIRKLIIYTDIASIASRRVLVDVKVSRVRFSCNEFGKKCKTT